MSEELPELRIEDLPANIKALANPDLTLHERRNRAIARIIDHPKCNINLLYLDYDTDTATLAGGLLGGGFFGFAGIFSEKKVAVPTVYALTTDSKVVASMSWRVGDNKILGGINRTNIEDYLDDYALDLRERHKQPVVLNKPEGGFREREFRVYMDRFAPTDLNTEAIHKDYTSGSL